MAASSHLELVQALQLACSQNPDEMKVGEWNLEAWKGQSGFYSELAIIFGDKSVEPVVRWMALTCIKNGVDQFWRPGAPNLIAAEEKARVRAMLLQNIEEPVAQVSTQLGVLIARIARMDCPSSWPELLPLLSEGVRSSSAETRKCYLRTMKHVVKELAGRRLPSQQKVFQKVTTSLFVYLLKLWGSHVEEGVAQVSRGEGQAAKTLELAHICLKILRQMVVYGIPKFNGIIEALQFVDSLVEQVPQLALQRGQLTKEQQSVKDILESNINLKMKIIIDLQGRQPIGFGPYVQRSLSLIYRLVFSTDSSSYLYEKLLISCLNLFRLILRCEDYNPPHFERMTESVLPPGIMEAHQAKLNFFTAETCNHILEQLVGHYLLLTDEELTLWSEDPEEYAKEKPGDNMDCSVRVCVQTALVALVHDFQLTVAPCLLALLQKVQSMDASSDKKSLHIKEAVYTAVGLCAFQLYDELDYDSWYQTHLLKELSIREPGYQIIRYRVVWLLGEWVTVKMSPSLRPSLYFAVVPLMAQDEHMAIRLAAKEVIKICVDDLEFKVEEFVPFLADCMNHMFQLLHDSNDVDSKMAVLNVLSLLVESIGDAIQPHVGSLLQALPGLWAESGEKNATVLRSVIISTLTNITKSLKSTSADLHEFTLPVIQLATDAKSGEHVYLAEDGLCLWLTTLLHCPAPSAALVQLLGNMSGLLGVSLESENLNDSIPMAGLMDIGSENLLLCFKILDAYAVLCSVQPEFFSESCGKLICHASQNYLCDVKPTAVLAIVQLLARVVQLYSPHVVEPILATVINKTLEEDYPPVLTAYLTLVARVLIHHPMFFFAFLEKITSQTHQTAAELFGLLMDVWSVNLDSIVNLQCRKLTGLAVANLLPVADVCVTSRFDSLVNMCVDVLHDVMDTTDQNEQYDMLMAGHDRDSSEEGGSTIDTQHDIRERKLSQYDPLRCISLHDHVTSKLEQCLNVHGPDGYTALINKVDIVVREQLLEFVPLKAAGHLLNISLHDTMASS